MLIEQTPKWFRAFFPGVIWRLPKKEKTVYLTFDDGPIPEATPFVLDLLEKHGIKATFFCVGDNVRKYPEIFEQIILMIARLPIIRDIVGGFPPRGTKMLTSGEE